MSQIAELKALVAAHNVPSPMLSEKSSCQPLKEDIIKVKPSIAKELKLDDDVVVFVDQPPTDKKGPRSCELAVDTITNRVAFGMVFDDGEMSKSVHGVPLQPGHVRVSVDGIIHPDALVPVPVPGEIEKVSEAVGSHIAWPGELVVFPIVDTEKKKEVQLLKSKNELQMLNALFNEVELSKNVPERYKFLYKYASTFMKASGASIQIPCDAALFGIEKKIYILDEDLVHLLEFDRIGQSAISTYVVYLHTLMRKDKKNDDVIMYGFFDPGLTFILNKEFQHYIVMRLNQHGSYNRIYFMPHNHKAHWILIVVWDGDIYILNPLPHQKHFVDLEKELSDALISYNAQTGRPRRTPKLIYLTGCPKQPGGDECGYVVMRFMRDMIFDKEMSYFRKWAPKSRKCYSFQELDEVRMETLKFIEDKVY